MFARHTRGMDVVMRYENIELDLREVFKRAGMDCETKLARVNRTDQRINSDYRSCYSRLAQLAVKLAYSQDLDMYGYEF